MGSKRIKQLIVGLAIIAAAVAAKTFLIEHFRIPQNGMYPGLPAHSGFWAYKRAYSTPAQVKRGDIVVFRWPGDRSQVWVKRVIGLPGDRIAMRDGRLIDEYVPGLVPIDRIEEQVHA